MSANPADAYVADETVNDTPVSLRLGKMRAAVMAAAAMEHRSLANFIRLALHEALERRTAKS